MMQRLTPIKYHFSDLYLCKNTLQQMVTVDCYDHYKVKHFILSALSYTHTHTNTHCDNYFLIKQLVFVNITNKYVNLCMLCEWQHRYMLMHQTFNPRIHVQFFIPLGLISINSRNKEQVDSQKMLTNDLSNVTVKDGFILFLLPWHHFRFTVLFDEGLGNQNGILDHHRSFI